jgi:hypothetical protein
MGLLGLRFKPRARMATMLDKARAVVEYLEANKGWDVLRDDTIANWTCSSCKVQRATNYCHECGSKGPDPAVDSGITEMAEALQAVFGGNDGE